MATTLAELIADKREIIEKALAGEVILGEDEGGMLLWGKGLPDECHEAVLESFDEITWNLREMAHASKAYEKVLTAYGYETKDYIRDFIYFKFQEEISDAGLTNEDFEKIAEEGIKALKKAKE